ncbi:MFS transporter [Saccharothrix australiensis]|uniref:EmrB/QacA subfamily drug resistance transporter n=1 Tax=Saccharothrix australiensis TaxID=2072 RepID=A0A495W2P7_9PSEU|nr:MFS transporter [Saccharothrix australiensis]RKT55644.1 EmrB/QacA subfamily drug resistance transporter [Saccharothrix australiensis]
MASGVSTAGTRAVRSRWWALVVICLVALIVGVDATIVNIALPSAQRDLGLSDVDRQWVVSAYTLAFGGLLLPAGRVADRVGRKRAVLLGVLGFAAASALGGAAAEGWVLVLARALQGVFASILAPSTLSLLVAVFTEPADRAKAISVFSAVASGGGVLGLLAGGLLAGYLDWRWCLYINVPLAVLGAIGGALLLPEVPAHRGGPIDVPGAVLGCAGVVALVYGLGAAGGLGWASPAVLGPLAAGLVLLAVFVLVQARREHPLLPLRVVLDRNRAGAALSIGLAMFALFGTSLFLTYQLQVVMGYSPVETGLAVLPLTVAIIVSSTQLARRWLPRTAPRLLVAPGLALAAAGVLWLVGLRPDSSFAVGVLPAELLLGLGMGLVSTPCLHTATSGVDPADVGVASAFLSTTQQIAASLGVATLNTIATSATASFAAAHPDVPAVVGTVHGYTRAAAWAGGIVLAAVALAWLMITADPRRAEAAKG